MQLDAVALAATDIRMASETLRTNAAKWEDELNPE
jgi:hypothetical protein